MSSAIAINNTISISPSSKRKSSSSPLLSIKLRSDQFASNNNEAAIQRTNGINHVGIPLKLTINGNRKQVNGENIGKSIESSKKIDEAFLEEKFAKLGLVSKLTRTNSPIVQLNQMLCNSDGDENEDDEDDNVIYRGPPVRSKSLRTGKTPPVMPHRKKIVRFADCLGLDLESIRIMSSDELPNIPQSAFGSLKLEDNESKQQQSNKWYSQLQPNKPFLLIEFSQPGSQLYFLDRVRTQRVCLENCIVSNGAGNMSIICLIRVLNITFEKVVSVRFTTNEWLSYNEALASYIPNSCDGWSDKFTVTFSLTANGYSLMPGQRILFAIRYKTSGDEFWDCNMGSNYSLLYRA